MLRARPIGQQVDIYTAQLDKMLDGLRDVEQRRILRKAAKPVVSAVRSTRVFKDRTGALRRSLDRVPQLRKTNAVFVGPRRGKRARRNADGYYAGAVFGSGREFALRVLEPAARRSRPEVVRIVERHLGPAVGRQAQKNNISRG